MSASLDYPALHQTSELLVGRGLAVLSAWVLLNLIVSGYYLAHADRRYEPFYFHGMNVSWGLVNAAIACWGVLHLHFVAPPRVGASELVQTQLANENLFLLNAGLDVAYIMSGFYLRALAAAADARQPARLLGFGWALWLQGGFLLVFDAAMWGLLHAQGQQWLPLLV